MCAAAVSGTADRLFRVYPFTAIVGQEAMKRALLAAVARERLGL